MTEQVSIDSLEWKVGLDQLISGLEGKLIARNFLLEQNKVSEVGDNTFRVFRHQGNERAHFVGISRLQFEQNDAKNNVFSIRIWEQENFSNRRSNVMEIIYTQQGKLTVVRYHAHPENEQYDTVSYSESWDNVELIKFKELMQDPELSIPMLFFKSAAEVVTIIDRLLREETDSDN